MEVLVGFFSARVELDQASFLSGHRRLSAHRLPSCQQLGNIGNWLVAVDKSPFALINRMTTSQARLVRFSIVPATCSFERKGPTSDGQACTESPLDMPCDKGCQLKS
jgi:hypothetical protein